MNLYVRCFRWGEVDYCVRHNLPPVLPYRGGYGKEDMMPRPFALMGSSNQERWRTFLEEVRQRKPNHVFTSCVGSLQDLAQGSRHIPMATYYAEQECVVYTNHAGVAKTLTGQNYPVAVSPEDFPGWVLRGGRVWIHDGSPLRQWQRYAELRALGIAIEGVIIGEYSRFLAAKGLVVTPDLHGLETSDHKEMDNWGISVEREFHFWRPLPGDSGEAPSPD